jgi:HD-GYP domain-containing protein (c-di-GMP phosphodiesterase class II)
MLLVLLVNGVLWTVVMHYYYQHKTAQQTIDIVKEELHTLDPLLKEVIPGERAALSALLENSREEWALPFLEVYREGEGVIFRHGSGSLPSRLRPFPDERPVISSPVHQLFQYNGDDYLYLYTAVFEKGWYMRVAIPVSRHLLNRAQETTNTVLVVVVATLLQVTVVLFPLMLAVYNRTLKDRSRLLMSNLWTVQALGNAIAKRDSDTDSHNFRVSYYALRLAEAVGLSPERMPGMIKGAFLHDIGKIGVPDSVLWKEERLTTEEYEVVKKHVPDGLEIIAGIPWLRDAVPVINGHHEHYNGEGYPNGSRGEDIPLEARIFCVVDVFDALTSRRPYKEAFSVEEALRVMDDAEGDHFDPGVYQIFRDLAPDLQQEVASGNRRQLRSLLTHAITPYFPQIMGSGRE